MTPYLWGLFFMLASATLFDGFDSAIVNSAAPQLQKEYGLTLSEWGRVNSLIRFGVVPSFFLVMLADKFGRRAIITLTIVGYAICTGLTAYSTGIWDFALCQFGSRIFLSAELALAVIILSEEYPTRWRGVGISSIGAITVLGVVLENLVARYVLTHRSWRTMYLLGLGPIVLVFLFRLGMRETRRFTHLRALRVGDALASLGSSVRMVFSRPYRGRVLLVSAIWNCSVAGQASVGAFYALHASSALGFKPAQYAAAMGFGVLFGLFGLPSAGWLMGVWGKRPTAILFFVLSSATVAGNFTILRRDVPTQALLFGMAAFAVCGSNSIAMAYGAELFPTTLRGTGYGLTATAFGRASDFLMPTLVGAAAAYIGIDHGGIARAMQFLAITPLVGALIVWRFAPETKGMTLEQSAAVSGPRDRQA